MINFLVHIMMVDEDNRRLKDGWGKIERHGAMDGPVGLLGVIRRWKGTTC